MAVTRAVALFIAAGLAEIGGGYLIWRWLRDGAPVIAGVAGAILLVGYGIIPTLQHTSDFGRVYAAYGGVFVIASLLWGWGVDGRQPDRYDWAGAAVVAAGVALIFFAPRRLAPPRQRPDRPARGSVVRNENSQLLADPPERRPDRRDLLGGPQARA